MCVYTDLPRYRARRLASKVMGVEGWGPGGLPGTQQRPEGKGDFKGDFWHGTKAILRLSQQEKDGNLGERIKASSRKEHVA